MLSMVNALTLVETRPVWAGAKAAAEPMRARAAADLNMMKKLMELN